MRGCQTSRFLPNTTHGKTDRVVPALQAIEPSSQTPGKRQVPTLDRLALASFNSRPSKRYHHIAILALPHSVCIVRKRQISQCFACLLPLPKVSHLLPTVTFKDLTA